MSKFDRGLYPNDTDNDGDCPWCGGNNTKELDIAEDYKSCLDCGCQFEAISGKIIDEGYDVSVFCRPEVLKMAVYMEKVLRDNDCKGGWKNCSKEYLDKKLKEEFDEARESLFLPINIKHDIGRDAVDLANIAMMIADNWGDLKEILTTR